VPARLNHNISVPIEECTFQSATAHQPIKAAGQPVHIHFLLQDFAAVRQCCGPAGALAFSAASKVYKLKLANVVFQFARSLNRPGLLVRVLIYSCNE
jgi:hypothetical protein